MPMTSISNWKEKCTIKWQPIFSTCPKKFPSIVWLPTAGMNTNVANLTQFFFFFDTFFSTNMNRLVTQYAFLQKKIATMQILHKEKLLMNNA